MVSTPFLLWPLHRYGSSVPPQYLYIRQGLPSAEMSEARRLAPEYNSSRVYTGVSSFINNHLGGSAAPVAGTLTFAVMRGRGRWPSVTATHTRPPPSYPQKETLPPAPLTTLHCPDWDYTTGPVISPVKPFCNEWLSRVGHEGGRKRFSFSNNIPWSHYLIAADEQPDEESTKMFHFRNWNGLVWIRSFNFNTLSFAKKKEKKKKASAKQAFPQQVHKMNTVKILNIQMWDNYQRSNLALTRQSTGFMSVHQFNSLFV